MCAATRKVGCALPRIHFDMMNTVNASTGFTAFLLHMGCSPRVMPPIVPRDPQIIFDIDTAKAERMVSEILEDEGEAMDNLLQAQVQQAYYANSYRGPEIVYEVGDRVMLSTMNRRTLFKKILILSSCPTNRISAMFSMPAS